MLYAKEISLLFIVSIVLSSFVLLSAQFQKAYALDSNKNDCNWIISQHEEKKYDISLTPLEYASLKDHLTAPAIIAIDMDQAYSKVKQYQYYTPEGSKKKYAAGYRTYASWSNKNVVKVKFKGATPSSSGEDFTVNYRIQRSTSATGAFKDIDQENANKGFQQPEEIGNGLLQLVDSNANRGTRHFYRVVADYEYFDQAQGKKMKVEKASNVVSVRTTPKTFAAKSLKVKSGKKWKSKAPFNVKKTHTYKISWKKRSDVSGYYVYRCKSRVVALNKVKSWQFIATDVGIGGQGSEGAYKYGVTAKRYCKKVKTLKSGATSFSFAIKDRSVSKMDKEFYAIIPFVKSNGKTYLADSKKAFYASTVSKGNPYKGYRTYVKPASIDYKYYFPFPLS